MTVTVEFYYEDPRPRWAPDPDDGRIFDAFESVPDAVWWLRQARTSGLTEDGPVWPHFSMTLHAPSYAVLRDGDRLLLYYAGDKELRPEVIPLPTAWGRLLAMED